MIEQAPEVPVGGPGEPLSSQSFLNSHRALAVSTREFSRFGDDLIAAATLCALSAAQEPPEVRKSPDRCIVQLGPVALTAAWLRNGSESPASSELLVIVWRGIVAPRQQHNPERVANRAVPAVPATVWEESFVASATSEATWHWHPDGLDEKGYDSGELAAQCVEQLNRALAAALSDEVAAA